MSIPLVTDPSLDQVLDRSGPGGQGKSVSENAGQGKNLLLLEPEAAAKELMQLWKRQDRLYKRRNAQWKVNRARRAGFAGVYLIKRVDTQEWQAYIPPGTGKQVPALNKAARLCRLVRGLLFVDPPVPEAVPAGDTDKDRDAAEFSTRLLIELQDESDLDDTHKAAEAFDLASTYGSGYRRYWTDPNGSEQPLSVLTLPEISVMPETPDGLLIDPQTGQKSNGPFVTKYVRVDGTLVDDPMDPQVQRVKVPKLKSEVLAANQVRFFPPVPRGLSEAMGVVIGAYVTLGDLRQRYGDAIPTDEAKLKKMVAFAEATDDLIPGGKSTRTAMEGQSISDSSLVWTVTGYWLAGVKYDHGCMAVAAGEETLLTRGPWYNDQRREPLSLPIDQIGQFFDEGNPHRMGMVEILGPGNEIRNSNLGAMLEHLDRFLNRKVFIPTNSSLQAKTMQAVTGTYVPVSPGGKPEYEQVPDFPQAAVDMFTLISGEMDHESGLEPPVSGENPAAVKSGLHARTIIEQVNVGLSELRNNLMRGLTRGWRIQLEQISAFFTRPQRIRWVTEDGLYKEREWSSSDLGSTRDVQLKTGTLSMLAPAAKTAVAEQMFNFRDDQGRRVLNIDELKRIVIGNVGGLVGVQDNPHLLRIRRQIEAWAAGPPEGWQAPEPVQDQRGQPVPGPDPALEKIWTPEPNDDEPDVATVRHQELSRLMSSQRYARWPGVWRRGVDQEYARMRQALGIVSAGQQQQAQAQQQSELSQLQQSIAQLSQFVQVALGQPRPITVSGNVSLSPPAPAVTTTPAGSVPLAR